jgi:type IV pilus assembly protein PilA
MIFKSLKNKKNKGFTLLELIIVIVILAVIAAFLVPSVLERQNKKKELESNVVTKKIESDAKKQPADTDKIATDVKIQKSPDG